MYLPALRASVVIWLAGFLAACSGGTEQAATNPVTAETPAATAPQEPAEPDPPEPDPPEPDPVDPSVSLQPAATSVNGGDSTTLTWSSQGTDTCTASGGWSGNKATSGNEVTAPINANSTFTLTCSGPLGNAVAMIEVAANGQLSISWQAPTENVDGSALTDLGGYTVYYGQSSGNYTGQTEVDNANATTFATTVASGEYYVAMTALDVEGNESALSNEVVKATL
jgi:hypothetical protein